MKKFLQSDRAWALLAVLLSALFGFMAMFGRAAAIFNEGIEDMSHGWLIVPFSLYALWSARGRIKESFGAPSLCGLIATIPCAVIAIFGTRGLQLRLEQLGFIGLCITIPWAFYGRRCAKHFVFPAIFLLFTIPLNTYLDIVTIHLRLLASGTALFILKGFGLDVIQRGTAVISQGAHPFSVDVAAPCSGMRSIFALMALTAAYAWFTQPTWLRRGILFSCSVPLAVLGNIIRILTICIVAAGTNQEFALGFYHDYSGYIVFIVAIISMVACGGLIDNIWQVRASSGQDDAAVQNVESCQDGCHETVKSCKFIPWLAVLLLVPLFVFQGLTPQSVVMEAPNVRLPEKLDGYRADYVRYCQNEQCSATFPLSKLEKGKEDVCPNCGAMMEGCSLGERTVLPSDTRIMKRQYTSLYGNFLVSAVIGGKSKSSIHRPELCMPAQGYQMCAPENLKVSDDRMFRSIRLESHRQPSVVLSYTFFNQSGMRTHSHIKRILADIWDRSVHNRIDRWVMITVAASAEGGFSLENDSQRKVLMEFLRKISEELP